MGIFVYAFTGVGKSTVARECSNVVDMESTKYKYLDSEEENEQTKGTERKLNPEWPKNYFAELTRVKDKYDYVLISDSICYAWLKENNIKYWQVYPNIELKQEYINRCKARGNNEEFISYFSKVWDDWVLGCKNDKNADMHIELKSGQYLKDVLPNLKLKKEKIGNNEEDI